MSEDVSENEDHHYFRKTEKQQKLVASTTKQHQQSDIKLHKCCDNLAKRLRGRWWGRVMGVKGGGWLKSTHFSFSTYCVILFYLDRYLFFLNYEIKFRYVFQVDL